MRNTLVHRCLAAAAVVTVAAGVLLGCATAPADDGVSDRAAAMMKSSFKARGQATLDRLDQDETQRLCSEYAGRPLPAPIALRIQQANLATIRYPADGKLAGDWKSGEKIAQSGQGFQYSDDPKKPAGANCYACHQLAPQELSYGTIGPSLYRFGKLRGYSEETRRYAWQKVYNAEAFAACSNMPRFGQHHILTEQQIRDVVALLVDPASPVNQ
ncbi:MAG TPA: sulfur oxidation c-type cytochrome SoxX [Casimicrobiaceae bacterium]|nr:sulfur oxidation c-type cytochrome SoxX [Casimicrobiaceae bacterium]